MACRSEVENPSKAMPSSPKLPPYLICVLDEAEFEKGAPVEIRRVFRKTVSTALFRFPHELSAENEKLSFRVRFHRSNFMRGLDVQILDKTSGADARFVGPAGAMRSSFMLGLTQGDRATRAKFLRLGCIFSQTPNAID